MGRPAINTVFNNVDPHKTDREAFNRSQPVEQPRLFEQHFQDVLTSLGAADPAGLAGVLLPDVLTYQTGIPPASSTAAGSRTTSSMPSPTRHQRRSHH